jgi:hypothetical protein
MTRDQSTHNEALAYMRRWFISRSHLADLCALDVQEMDPLIAAGCAPGIIYSHHEHDGWWSALAAAMGNAPPCPPAGGTNWYSPGARWWLRRAILTQRGGKTAKQAAKENRRYFCADFTDQISRFSYAHFLFGEQVNSVAALSKETIAQKANAEWQDWLSGAFAVCLIHFSAETCIRKGALGALIKSKATHMDQEDEMAIFNLIEELAPFMTPFAPWERSPGTPGQAIDSPLAHLRLGAELPYRKSE